MEKVIKKQLDLPKSYNIIKTPVQAAFHLNKGEVLTLPVTWFVSIFIMKDEGKDDSYEVALVPLFGKAQLFEGDFKAVSGMIEEYDFFVIKGATLQKRKLSIWDKIIDRLKERRCW